MNKRDKIIKIVKEYITKEKSNYELRRAGHIIDSLFKLEAGQRNKARAKIYKVSDKVEFYAPDWCVSYTLKGTIEKIGFRKIKIKTDDGTFNVHATKVGKPIQEKKQ